MLRAQARLSDDGKRIEIRFPYSRTGLAAIHAVPGATWVPKKKCWTASRDLTTARRLREEFGAGLQLEQRLRVWARSEMRRNAARRTLSQARSSSLEVVPRVLPELAALLDSRPYQSADIERMAESNCLNANEPGTGKTIEIIGTIAEAGLLDKPALIIAPVRSIENTWAAELARVGYPHWVGAFEDPQSRKGSVNYAWMLNGAPCCVVINPDLLRVKPAKEGERIVVRDPVSGDPYAANQWTENILSIDWGLIAIDEFHGFGLTNPRSQFGLAARLLRADRMILASGTPMGGKYKRLWATLNWLDPVEYGSWWRWAAAWLVIKDNGFGKVVLDEIQPGREDEFYEAHAHHYLRRTKLKDLPGCPAKVHKTILTPMTTQQSRQYRKFEEDAEIRIGDRRLAGHGILAEWGRLRSFANATCRVVEKPNGDYTTKATPDSGKLGYLLDALAETGCRKSQPEPGVRAIVGSMDKSFVEITAAYLEAHGIETGLLTGDTKDSKPLLRRFRSKNPKPYVLVMTIQTGGVSLNLQEASSIHALDESWDPDHMTQFFDRGDRGSRTTPLLCFTYRSRRTIQEYIAEVAAGKVINNKNAYEIKEKLSRARSR